MAPTLSALLAQVPDPTDFPAHAGGLRALDGALRCAICAELLDAPAALGCGHSFCSLCAREALQARAECPACRKPASETQLRANHAMDEAVAAWKQSRSFILDLLKENEALRARPPHSSTSQPPSKRKRRAPASDEEDVEDVLSPVAGPSRRPTPRTTSSSSSSTPALASPRKPRPRKREEEEEVPASSDVEELAPSARVPCPLCAARVPIAGMDAHIERGCASTASAPASTKAQWAGLMGGGKPPPSAEPLPSVSYGTLKDKAIKALLLAHKLPAGGARPAWIARHKRWVLLWNANLDRAPRARRGADELRAELRRWEDAQRGKPAPAAPDADTHARANKSEFARLVAQARPAKAGTPASSETEAAAG